MCKRSRAKKSRAHQRTFDELGPGGTRKGAGRKPKGKKAGLVKGLPSLRRRAPHRIILAALDAAKDRFGMSVIHFSVQSNHIHMIIEAEERVAMARGLKGLQVRFARNLNNKHCLSEHWTRKGRVCADRYHDHVLRTPMEVRNAIGYVLHNSRKHGLFYRDCADPYCSGQWFPDWAGYLATPPANVSPISPARTWLTRVGWRRHGPIAPYPMNG